MMRQVGHGDLYFRRVKEEDVPSEVRAELQLGTAKHVVLARGEATGHAHVMTSEKPIGFKRVDDTVAYMLLRDAGLLEHEEHGTRTLAPGWYEVPLERDYDPSLYERRVVD